MRVRVLCLAAGLGPLLLVEPQPLGAGFQGFEVGVKENDFNILTFNVYAVFDNPGLDRMNAVAGTVSSPMSIFIKGGSMYQNSFGADRPPLDVAVQAFPSLAYDTFVTIGVKSVGLPGGQPGDEMILTPGWPGFGSCVLASDNMAWAVTPITPQGDPFDPVHCFPGDGRVLIGQFSTADGYGITGEVVLQMVSDGVSMTQSFSFEHDVAPPASAPCSACGPGPHWIGCCAGGLDASSAEVGMRLDTLDDGNFDGQADVVLRLGGPVEVERSNPADDSASFPGTAPLDEHLDVIDAEIVAMDLVDSASGVTLSAGGTLAPTLGATVELVANDAVGSSFFEVFFKLDMGGGTFLYNQDALPVQVQITCEPPQVTYIYFGDGLDLFTSPNPGQGEHAANLLARASIRFGFPIRQTVGRGDAAALP